MINDVVGDLGQAVDVGFPGPEIAALYGVVKEAKNGVTVVLVVFCRIDPALSGNGMGPARAVLDAEGFDIIAKFTQGRSCRSPGQAGADNNNFIFAFVGRVDQFIVKFAGIPFVGQRSCWYLCVKLYFFIISISVDCRKTTAAGQW